MCQDSPSGLHENRMSVTRIQTPRQVDSHIKVLEFSTCHGHTSRNPCHGTAHRVSIHQSGGQISSVLVDGDNGRRNGSTYRGAAADTAVTEAAGAASIAGVKLSSGGADFAGGAGGGHGEAGEEGEGDGGESHFGGCGCGDVERWVWIRWLMVKDGMGMTRWAARRCLL